MAITPDEAILLTVEEIAELGRLEEHVDGLIREQFSQGKCAYFEPPRGLSLRMRNELMQRYRSVGWQVTFSDSQRDGPCLKFERASAVQPGGYRE